MSDSFIKPGLEVVLSVGPIAGLSISSGKIVSVGDESLTLQTDGKLLFVRPGVLLEVNVPDRQKEGWSELVSLDGNDERNLMELTFPRWSDTSRSPRRHADYRVKISSVEATSDGPKLRQISGYTANISMTGAKFYVGKELDTGGLYQVELHLNDKDGACTAVGKVVRVAPRSGDQKDAWEVGIHFVRFISGLADYAKAVGEAAFSKSVGEVPDFDDEVEEDQAA